MRLSIQHKAKIFLAVNFEEKVITYSSETNPHTFIMKVLIAKKKKKNYTNENFEKLLRSINKKSLKKDTMKKVEKEIQKQDKNFENNESLDQKHKSHSKNFHGKPRTPKNANKAKKKATSPLVEKVIHENLDSELPLNDQTSFNPEEYPRFQKKFPTKFNTIPDLVENNIFADGKKKNEVKYNVDEMPQVSLYLKNDYGKSEGNKTEVSSVKAADDINIYRKDNSTHKVILNSIMPGQINCKNKFYSVNKIYNNDELTNKADKNENDFKNLLIKTLRDASERKIIKSDEVDQSPENNFKNIISGNDYSPQMLENYDNQMLPLSTPKDFLNKKSQREENPEQSF
jgi:hypothetical protein